MTGGLRRLNLFLLACLAACAPADQSETEARQPAPSAPASRTSTPPAEPPDIRGTVTAVDAVSVRIEEDPTAESGSAKAIVRLTPQTRVLYRDGQVATSADIDPGRDVSAWYAGPVMESYPIQTTASVIMIEPIDARPSKADP